MADHHPVQVATALGQAPTGQLEGRIETQNIKIVAILVAAGDGEQARPDHVGVSMGCAREGAPIRHASDQMIGDPEPSLDPGQQQDAAIR